MHHVCRDSGTHEPDQGQPGGLKPTSLHFYFIWKSPPRFKGIMKRRTFLQGLMGTMLLGPKVYTQPLGSIPFSLFEPELPFAHILRDSSRVLAGWKTTSKPRKPIEILIAGGGIGGLSCARILERHQKNYLLLEASTFWGGTSASHTFDGQAAPLGAHYLVTPPSEAVDVLEFLKEAGVVTGIENQLPIYHKKYVLDELETRERSLSQGRWQAGIGEYFKGPSTRLRKFYRFMDFLSEYRGEDSRRWFSLPSHTSSKDPRALDLFQISFESYLRRADLLDDEVRFVTEYACNDDYGSTIGEVSAWAGLHYFCCRPRSHEQVILSSQMGNGYLVESLLKKIPAPKRQLQNLLCSVRKKEDQWECLIYTKNGFHVQPCKALVFCGKSHVPRRLFPENPEIRLLLPEALEQAPWLVSQILLRKVPEDLLRPLCWDNVSKESRSVGYVYSNFFQEKIKDPVVLTHFYPTKAARGISGSKLGAMKSAELGNLVLEDFQSMNPELIPYVQHVILRRHVHGMGIPKPGWILPSLREHRLPQNFYMANSDSFGLPLFEEAFQAGVHTAHALVMNQ